MRFDTKRLILSLIVVFGAQMLLSRVVAYIPVQPIWQLIIYCGGVALLFGLLNYPVNYWGKAFKDPYFYRYVAIMFVVLFLFNWLF